MISSASYPTWRLETLFAERQMREGIVSLSRQCWASWKMLIVCWIRWKIYFFLNKRGSFDTFDLKNIYLTKVQITYVNRNILISYFSYILLYKEYWNSQKILRYWLRFVDDCVFLKFHLSALKNYLQCLLSVFFQTD